MADSTTPAPVAPAGTASLTDIKAALADIPVIAADLSKIVADVKSGNLQQLPTLVSDAKAFIKDFADCLGKAQQAVAELRGLFS
ncbi:MAG: hypothetical protein ACP5XB_09170 [Isosphaeraceae bacterium]